MRRTVYVPAICVAAALVTGIGLRDQESGTNAAAIAAAPASGVVPDKSASEAEKQTPKPAATGIVSVTAFDTMVGATSKPAAAADVSVDVGKGPGATNGHSAFRAVTTNGTNVVVIQVAPETGKVQDKISIEFQDTELQEVVQFFIRMTDANIMYVATNLEGKVSVRLKDVEWRTALEEILAERGLVLRDVSGKGVFRIQRQQPGMPEPLIMETVTLKYAQVMDVSAALKPALDPRGKISEFKSRNTLIVQSTKENLKDVKTIIEKLDVPRGQVFIEAKFMELNDQAIKNLGINWQPLAGYGIGVGKLSDSVNENLTSTRTKTDRIGKTDNRNSQDSVNQAYDATGTRFDQKTPVTSERDLNTGALRTQGGDTIPTRQLSDTINKGLDVSSTLEDTSSRLLTEVRTAVLGIDDFRLVLSALKEQQGISIVSNPKLIVANGEPALIHIGEIRRPFISTVTPGTLNSAPTINYNPGEPVRFGVELNVTPTINTDSNITVVIEPILTRSAGADAAPNGQTYPIVAQKRIKTLFSLESGKTAAIGGLTETEDNKTTKKIPLLGDIPFVGKYLFSHTSDSKAQRETIIFVTVGLANIAQLERNIGIPQSSELVHTRLLLEEQRKREFDEDLRKAKAADDSHAEKAKKRSEERIR